MTRENIPEKMDAGSFLKPLISIFSSSFINLSNGLLSPALRWTADQERVLPVVIRAHIHCSKLSFAHWLISLTLLRQSFCLRTPC